MRRLLLFVILLCSIVCLWSQPAVNLPQAPPSRLHYFPSTGRNYSALDPGDELLQRNLLISNQAGGANVSFALSFDKDQWNGFALAPRYSSIFNLDGQQGCFIRVRTQIRPNQLPTEVVYFLIRGKCYSVYWNKNLQQWDIAENVCRAY